MKQKDTHEIKRCGAKTRGDGTCRKFPVRGGNGRCERHNGNAVKGPAHPNWKDGKYSKYFPVDYKEIYDETQTDEALLSNRSEIRVAETFIIATLDNLKTGESEESWITLSKIIEDLKDAYLSGDGPLMGVNIQSIINLANDQIQSYQAQNKVMELIEQRRKLVETEQKMALAGERAVTVEQLFWLVGAVVSIIETVVKSQDERSEIGYRVDQLIAANS